MSNRQIFIDHLRQRQALCKPFASACNFELHHRDKLPSGTPLCNVVFADAVPGEIVERQIDAALDVIHSDILPEVGKLESGTGVVGELLTLLVPVTAEIQDQAANRIGRIPAVVQHMVESGKASHGLVLPKSGQ